MPIVARAGDAIMRVYGDPDFAVQRKEDNSPLTLADLESQRHLIEGLRELTPDIPILSEESAQAPWDERRNWRELWVVDPLDGTREFIKRNGEFTVNVALVVEHEPVLGVVAAPALGLLYWGARRSRRLQSSPGCAKPAHPGFRPTNPPARGRQPFPRRRADRRLPRTAGSALPARRRQFAEILLGGGRQGRPLSALRPHLGVGHGRRTETQYFKKKLGPSSCLVIVNKTKVY